jgi:hypothetical protein
MEYQSKIMPNQKGNDARHFLVKGRWQTPEMLSEGDYKHLSLGTIKNRLRDKEDLDKPLKNSKDACPMQSVVYSSKFEEGAHISLPVVGWGSLPCAS